MQQLFWLLLLLGYGGEARQAGSSITVCCCCPRIPEPRSRGKRRRGFPLDRATVTRTARPHRSHLLPWLTTSQRTGLGLRLGPSLSPAAFSFLRPPPPTAHYLVSPASPSSLPKPHEYRSTEDDELC
ncbi:hypothetical protein GALMADRAFT_227179 [Galerina marginata CBS 339.88]|uniref:Secreted protein n=1 Tax=Galerina marginata (strain CBS 339.88) TaxID=685588 RepID=A0A067T4B8_GALM3|nr:hypothetical protein GALMADRAFT_227179 [Galerina marginata CBS 339.88]